MLININAMELVLRIYSLIQTNMKEIFLHMIRYFTLKNIGKTVWSDVCKYERGGLYAFGHLIFESYLLGLFE